MTVAEVDVLIVGGGPVGLLTGITPILPRVSSYIQDTLLHDSESKMCISWKGIQSLLKRRLAAQLRFGRAQ